MSKILILSVLIGMIILAGCANVKKDQNTIIENNKLQADIDGYSKICSSKPTISVFEGGSWKLVNTILPGKGQYFLDGNYHGYGMCDYDVCNKIEQPVQIDLVEYIKVGEKESLETERFKVPEFNTKKLSGKIKVELSYYADSSCKNEKTFTKIVEILQQNELPVNKSETASPPNNKESCESLSGIWKIWRETRDGQPECNLPTPDAGKICTDSSQCASYCEAPKGSEIGAEVEGSCYAFRIAGCMQEVKKGIAAAAWCY